jgi:hypothetical protein
MSIDSNVKLTIQFTDSDLDAEEQDEASRWLLAQLKDLDEIELAERVIDLRDIRRSLLDTNPQIVHFCGHGKGNSIGIETIPNEARKMIPVDPLAAADEGGSLGCTCTVRGTIS